MSRRLAELFGATLLSLFLTMSSDIALAQISAADCPAESSAGLLQYTVRSGDYDLDGNADVFLQPASFTQGVPIPYSITIQLDRASVSPPLVLLSDSLGDYSLLAIPDPQTLQSTSWQVGRHNIQLGDFDGDGAEDVFLQAQITGESSALILGYGDPVSAVLRQSIDATTLGVSIAEGDNKSVCAQDLNEDGRDDLLVEEASAADLVSYAFTDGSLGALVPHPPCDVGGAPDSDCDGVADRYDALPFDPTETVDTDLDGIGNNADDDDDNDGQPDAVDTHVLDALNGNPVGATAGTAAVTPQGKFRYRIPVHMVPSVANVLDPIALAYDGQLGNDLVGVGWYVEGLSEITRCPTTLAHDGYINGVNFNSSDKFCLDGQRLEAVSGVYGADGTIYRTAIDNYTRVVAMGSAASGTRWFEARSKDGRIRSYGLTSTSRRETQGAQQTVSWSIERVEDREGNAADYSYFNNQADGEHYVTRINYTRNDGAGLVAANSIRFGYEARQDVSPSHANSVLTDIRSRLVRISTYLGETEIRWLQLDYAGGASADYDGVSGRSRLKEITECVSDVGCRAPTVVQWDTHTPAPSFTAQADQSDTATYPPGSTYANQQWHVGDVNADGRSDAVWTYRDVNTLGRVVYLADSDGAGFTQQPVQFETGYTSSAIAESDQQYLNGDVNGDGRMDLVWVGRLQSTVFYTIYLADADGGGFTSQGYQFDSEADYGLATQGQFRLADTNGDGRLDLVWTCVLQGELSATVYLAATDASGQISLVKTSRLIDTDLSPEAYGNQEFHTGDVNGDGRSDLVWAFTYQNQLVSILYLSRPDGAGFFKISATVDASTVQIGSLYSNQQVHLTDVNGDRKADLVWTYTYDNQLGRVLYLSSQLGTSFEHTSVALDNSPLNPNTHSQADARFSDLNGDGKLDLIYNYIDSVNNNYGFVCFLADGDGRGFSQACSNTVPIEVGHADHNFRFADTTGDGVADLVWLYTGSANRLRRRVYTQPPAYPDHVRTITDGMGKQVGVEYDFLANTAIYQSGSGTLYPQRDDNGTGYVVTALEVSNGVGGLNRVNYAYTGARTDLSGRGFLGFEERRVTDLQSGFVTTERYRQDYPFIGRLESSLIEQGDGSAVEKIFHHWQAAPVVNPDTDTTFVYIRDSAFVKNELDGVEITSKVTERVYDVAHGNLTNSVETVGLGFTGAIDASFDRNGAFVPSDISNAIFSQSNEYQFANDSSSNWLIGFLLREALTSHVTDSSQPDKTVVHSYVPYGPSTHLRLSETLYEGSGVSSTTTFTRDSYGNSTAVVTTGDDIDGTQLTPQSTAAGPFLNGIYPQTRTNEVGHVTTFSYDERLGRVSQSVDPNGRITDYDFDGFGRLLRERSAEGVLTRYDYRPCVSTLCSTYAAYQVSRTVTHPQRPGVFGEPPLIEFFDILDREVRRSTVGFAGASILTDTIYDNRGRRAALSEPRFSGAPALFSVWLYDDLDRVTHELSPDGGTVDFVYGSDPIFASRLQSTETILSTTSSPRVISNLRQYNALGQLVLTTDPQNTTTGMLYDAQGSVARVRVVNGADAPIEVSVTTDVAGNQVMIDDPDAGVIVTEYDGLSRSRRRTQGVGVEQVVEEVLYDGLSRRLQRHTTKNGVTLRTAFAYDLAANGKGLPFYEFVPNEHLRVYRYDSLARPSTITFSTSTDAERVVAYDYDIFGRRQSTAFPSGLTIEDRYSANGYHSEIRDASTGKLHWRVLDQDARQNRTRVRFGNALETVRVFRPDNGLVQTIRTGPADDPDLIQALTYSFDTSANLERRQTTRAAQEDVTEQFGYDLLNRLRSASTTGLSSGTRLVDYHYDPYGNIVTKSDVSDVDGYSYGEAGSGGGPHAVSSVSFGGSSTAYAYDSRGNMRTAGARVIEYTDFNKPSRVTQPGADVQFAYDASRRRFRQQATINGQLTETHYYRFPGGRFEVIEEGGRIREKSYVGDYLVHSKLRTPGATGAGSDVTYLHRDHLGSTEAVTNYSGQLVARMVFAPYGSRRQDDWGDSTTAFASLLAERTFRTTTEGFGAHEHVDAVGLIHMGGRVYDPAIGRFLTPDPFVEFPELSQNYNRYSYALNNPLSVSDPTGNLPIIPIIIIAYKIYDTYDTVTSGVEDLQTTLDSSATTSERVRAGASLFFNTVGVPKPIRKIAGKTVDAVVDRTPSAVKETISRQADRVASAVDRATAQLNPNGLGNPGTLGIVESRATRASRIDADPDIKVVRDGGGSGRAVRPGDEGTFGELKSQKRRHGETEPLHMDHQPSYAAQKQAAERELGRPLTPEEARALHRDSPAVASPREVHQGTSPTYGGRNTPQRIAGDADDLTAAAARDRQVFDDAMSSRE